MFGPGTHERRSLTSFRWGRDAAAKKVMECYPAGSVYPAQSVGIGAGILVTVLHVADRGHISVELAGKVAD